jgi:hypothetical protein
MNSDSYSAVANFNADVAMPRKSMADMILYITCDFSKEATLRTSPFHSTLRTPHSALNTLRT